MSNPAKDWEIVKEMLSGTVKGYGLSLTLKRWAAACKWAKENK